MGAAPSRLTSRAALSNLSGSSSRVAPRPARDPLALGCQSVRTSVRTSWAEASCLHFAVRTSLRASPRGPRRGPQSKSQEVLTLFILTAPSRCNAARPAGSELSPMAHIREARRCSRGHSLVSMAPTMQSTSDKKIKRCLARRPRTTRGKRVLRTWWHTTHIEKQCLRLVQDRRRDAEKKNIFARRSATSCLHDLDVAHCDFKVIRPIGMSGFAF